MPVKTRAPGRLSVRIPIATAAVVVTIAACGPDATRPEGAVGSTTTPSLTGPDRPVIRTEGRPRAGDVAVTTTNVVVPVVGPAEDGAGWLVGTPCGRTARARGLRRLRAAVVLDAGHGGSETGAVGPLGTRESDLNLAVVTYAQHALSAAGIDSIPTRTADYRIAIASRAAIVAAARPKAMVSVHFNSVPAVMRPSPGTEVFHQSVGGSRVASRRLGGLVHEEVTATLGTLGLGQWAATYTPGVKHRQGSEGDDFYGILRRTQGFPTALAEIGFISNEAEELLYSDPANQERIGAAIASAVIRFLNTDDPGSGYVESPDLADGGGRGGGTDNCVDPPLDG